MRHFIQTLSAALATLLISGGIATAQQDQDQQNTQQSTQQSAGQQSAGQQSAGQQNQNQASQDQNVPQPEPDPTTGQQGQRNPQGQDQQSQQGQNWQGQGSQNQSNSGMSAGPAMNPYPNRVFTLRYDAAGREFICVNGQRVYFDGVASTHSPMASDVTQDDRYEAAFGNPDQDPAAQSQDSTTDGQGNNANNQRGSDQQSQQTQNQNQAADQQQPQQQQQQRQQQQNAEGQNDGQSQPGDQPSSDAGELEAPSLTDADEPTDA